jgi:hypothetical protein
VHAIVEYNMFKISRAVLAYGSHCTHVHYGSTVSIQAVHLPLGLEHRYAHGDGRSVAHAAHSKKVSFVSLLLVNSFVFCFILFYLLGFL